MGTVAGAGDGQDVVAAVEGPGEPDLRRGHAVGLGDLGDLGLARRVAATVRGGGGKAAGDAGRDGEEGHEGDAMLGARVEQGVVLTFRQPVPVLHAHHRRDLHRLGQLLRPDVGDAEVPDQSRFAQFGEGAEVLGDGAGLPVHPRAPAQVDDVEVVEPELADVLLDLGAQLLRPRVLERAVAGAACAHFRGDDQLVGVRLQRRADQLVDRAGGQEVEGRGVDVVDAELDGAAQQGDGAGAVPGPLVPGHAGQAHRAVPDPVDGAVAEAPGARRGGRCAAHVGVVRHGSSLRVAFAARTGMATTCRAVHGGKG